MSLPNRYSTGIDLICHLIATRIITCIRHVIPAFCAVLGDAVSQQNNVGDNSFIIAVRSKHFGRFLDGVFNVGTTASAKTIDCSIKCIHICCKITYNIRFHAVKAYHCHMVIYIISCVCFYCCAEFLSRFFHLLHRIAPHTSRAIKD